MKELSDQPVAAPRDWLAEHQVSYVLAVPKSFIAVTAAGKMRAAGPGRKGAGSRLAAGLLRRGFYATPIRLREYRPQSGLTLMPAAAEPGSGRG